MAISLDRVKELREMTSCGVIDCKKALEEAKGDFEKAKAILLKKGLELAAKKEGRVTKEGRIEVYIHPGNKLGVLLEVNCETDFVAKNQDFCGFTKDVAMHIAACSPKFIKREDVSAETLKSQKDREMSFKEQCLVDQPFVKDPKVTIKDCMNLLVAKIGENIIIGRFVRFKVGE